MGIKGESEGGLVPSWVFWSMAKVNKGMRTVSDSVWQWGYHPFPNKMDTLNTLLLGWLFFALLLIVLAKFLYEKYLSGGDDEAAEDYLNLDPADEGGKSKLAVGAGGGGVSSPPPPAIEVSKTPTIVPTGAPDRIPPPLATGGDPDAIRWINNLLVWFFEGSEGGRVVRDTWNDALNEFTVRAALEAGVLVEVLEFFPQSLAPHLTNIIVDCDPSDNISITCDMEETIYLRVQTTRTQREVTSESEYACAVRPLRGRLNITVETHDCAAFVKFDGWPEVQLEFEGVRNNSVGLDEEQLIEVINEVMTAALRKVSLHLDFRLRKNFPRFSRARSLPDQVIPVGYDSLVREAQTHPPSFMPKVPVSRKPLLSSSVPKDIDEIKSQMGIQPSAPKARLVDSTVSGPSSKVKAPATPRSSYYEEDLEEAGESFSAMSYSPPPPAAPPLDHEYEDSQLHGYYSPHGYANPQHVAVKNQQEPLTLSEENLIKRRFENYETETSLEHDDLSTILAKYAPEDRDFKGKDISNYDPDHRSYGRDHFYGKQVPRRPTKESSYKHELSVDLQEEPSRMHNLIVGKTAKDTSPTLKPVVNGSPSSKKMVEKDPFHSLVAEKYPIPSFSSIKSSIDDFPSPNDSFIEDGEDDEIFLDGPEKLKETLRSMADTRTRLPTSPSTSVSSSSPRDSIRDEMDLLKDSIMGPPNSFAHPQHYSPVGIVGLNGKRLLVKVVKASGIGSDSPVDASYAVVEMDDPSQRFTTSVVSESNAPFWDEQFLFDLSENTLELLFEIYDKTDRRFLGLGIVGIEELVATPSQRQIIPLQARPYENDKVSGSLTCEFLFLDRADLPELSLRSGVGGIGESCVKLKSVPATYVKSVDETASDESSPGVAGAAIIDLDDRVPSTKSSMVIHASRKEVNRRQIIKPMEDPSFEGPASVSTPRAAHGSQPPSPVVLSSLTSSSKPLTTNLQVAVPSSEISDASIQSSPAASNTDERSRSRNRGKRDFFGSLRRRFSRSKNRSQSVEPTNIGAPEIPLGRDPLAGRSVSVERSTTASRSRGFLSVPMSGKNRSSSSGLAMDSGSTRSSLSGTSGLSSASTKTYINEASLLVVETLENGIIKHYLVPLALQRKNKWRKKGTKLHIYNEHTFVAKHMSSGIACQVCSKGLARRLGKQGYECRDCSIKCHKPCHVKIENPCPSSTVNSMDLVYVKDERAERKKSRSS